ncbi:MAG: prepilin peptidase [Alphaproteobacteria bacterium]
MTPQPVVWLLPALLLLAAGWDLWRMQIPNTLCALMAAGFVAAALLAGLPWPALLIQLGIGLATLAVTVVLFAFRLFGGGDGKLLAATVMWYAPSALPLLFLAMALIGGALALLFLLLRRRPLSPALARQPWLSRLLRRDAGIPYAPAIAGGALIALPDLAWRVTIL